MKLGCGCRGRPERSGGRSEHNQTYYVHVRNSQGITKNIKNMAGDLFVNRFILFK